MTVNYSKCTLETPTPTRCRKIVFNFPRRTINSVDRQSYKNTEWITLRQTSVFCMLCIHFWVNSFGQQNVWIKTSIHLQWHRVCQLNVLLIRKSEQPNCKLFLLFIEQSNHMRSWMQKQVEKHAEKRSTHKICFTNLRWNCRTSHSSGNLLKQYFWWKYFMARRRVIEGLLQWQHDHVTACNKQYPFASWFLLVHTMSMIKCAFTDHVQ